MMILVVGATGKTGSLLVEQLLEGGHQVRVVARSPQKFSAALINNSNLSIVEAAVLDLSDKQLEEQVKDCSAVVSCLGHSLDFKGMFGHPRTLCTTAAMRLCKAIEKNNSSVPVKFILMNSVGVRNPDCDA